MKSSIKSIAKKASKNVEEANNDALKEASEMKSTPISEIVKSTVVTILSVSLAFLAYSFISIFVVTFGISVADYANVKAQSLNNDFYLIFGAATSTALLSAFYSKVNFYKIISRQLRKMTSSRKKEVVVNEASDE